MMATREIPGTISLRSCRRFPLNSSLRRLTPVMLPPGRARLVTIPVPSGSDAGAITIGIVLVTQARLDEGSGKCGAAAEEAQAF